MPDTSINFPETTALDEPDLGIEVIPHLHEAATHLPGLRVVVDSHVVGMVSPGPAWRLSFCSKTRHDPVLSEAPPTIHTEGTVKVVIDRELPGRLTIHDERTDARTIRQFTPQPSHTEVIAWRSADRLGLHIQQPHGDTIRQLSRQSGTTQNRNRLSGRADPDSTAKEEFSLTPVPESTTGATAHVESRGILKKERAFLRKE